MVFKKCRENPDDVLFIDASRDFARGVNQNRLRDEDIAKIIETYLERKVISDYSYRATLTEVDGNDYNLNIPRYIETHKDSEELDLDEIVTELRKIEADQSQIDLSIKEFTDELGIEAPF